MTFTRQYKQFLKPEKRVPKSLIKPRNIYRITTYKGGNPVTKSGEDARYIFVVGIVDGKVHSIKLNDIRPVDFTNFIFKLRDKRIPLGSDQMLHLFLKRFSVDGKGLFESYIKPNSKIYSKSLGNYRTYILNNIQNVYEIRFELDFLQELFKEGSTASTRQADIEEEIDQND